MRILFVGTVRFSENMLRKLIEINADVVGVVTGPDSGLNADYADLSSICADNGIACHLTEDINNVETIAWVKRQSPDVIFCLGWSRLLGAEFLVLPKMGVVGFHPTELPKNRGRHPLIWALVLGLKQTASTFIFMDAGADSGDILSQKMISVTDVDDALSLYEKVEQVAETQLVEIVAGLESADYARISQDESKANYWRKRCANDGRIDWRMSASSIHNLVRGLTRPYIGAEFCLGDEVYKVWRSRPLVIAGIENSEPGKVLEVKAGGSVVLKCGEQCIELLETEPVLHVAKGQYL